MAERNDGVGRGLLRGSAVSVAVRLIDLPSRYGFHLIVAARLGVAQAGDFYIVFSLMTLLAGLGRIGVDKAITREVAVACAENRPGDVRRIVWRGYLWILCASVLVAATLALAAAPLAARVLGKPELAYPILLGALAIVPQNLSTAAGGALAGLKRIGFSQMIYSWLWPALFCGITWLMPSGVTNTVMLIAACFAAAAVIGTLLVLRFAGRAEPGKPGARPAPLLRPGLSLFTLELTQLAISSVPALILGMTTDSARVGLFAVSWRVALLTNVLVSGVAAMAAPTFAGLHAVGDRAGLAQAARHAVLLGLALTAGPVLAMLAAPELLLGFLGDGFSDGATTLRILALGQFGAACFTALPELLGMTGHLADLRRVNVVAMMVLLTSCAVLSHFWLNDGAALAITLAILVNGAGAAIAARRALGIVPWRASCTSAS
ncbi:MAG: oligosaccharide flippase family protein [Proteobacteria bacterium]|nr:oligosaccharide flippase family protein [Pseudomonadota bacterium]